MPKGTKVWLFAAAAAALSVAGLAAWHARGRADAPASLPDLARAAEAAGYRVVPTCQEGGPRDGFYAVPADDARGWVELSLLLRGEPGWRDLRAVLDEEVNRLPNKYRAPFVLCYLEGRTTDETARQLGCPRGTVGTRLAWARQRLRTRLTRRGIALSAGALATLLDRNAVTAGALTVPDATVQAALLRAAGGAGGTIPPQVAALTEGVLKAMWMNRVKAVSAALLAAVVLGTGAGVWAYRALAQDLGAARAAGEARPAAQGPGTPKEPGKKTDGERLQGSWAIMSVERDGKTQPEKDVKAQEMVYGFAGDTLRIIVGGKGPFAGKTSEVTFRLEPGKRPKEIDLVEAGKPSVVKGIYLLDGDNLSICLAVNSKDRPTEFATKADGAAMLLGLRKTSAAPPKPLTP